MSLSAAAVPPLHQPPSLLLLPVLLLPLLLLLLLLGHRPGLGKGLGSLWKGLVTWAHLCGGSEGRGVGQGGAGPGGGGHLCGGCEGPPGQGLSSLGPTCAKEAAAAAAAAAQAHTVADQPLSRASAMITC